MTKATTTGLLGSHRRKHKFQRSGLPTTGFVIITVLAVLLASAYYAEAGSSASSMLKRNNNFVRVIEKYKYLQKSLRLSEMKKKDEMVFSSDFNQRKTSIYDNISNVFDTIYQNISSYEYGIVVVINKKGDVLFSKSYGTKEPFGLPSKNTSYLDDIFAISEVSSSFTATSMLHLSEKGILGGNFDNLDANQYLPDSLKFKPEIIGNFGSVLGHPVISSNDTVTIGSLLTHTTGLDSRLVGSCSRSKVHESEENASEFLLHYLESMRVPRIRKYDFVSSFSHIGYSMLGLILEKATGEKFHEYVTKHILRPMNMSHTYMRYSTKHVGEKKHFVLPIVPTTHLESLQATEMVHDVIPNYCWYAPGIFNSVGMYSSPRDMAKWALLHLNYGEIFPSELDPTVQQQRIFSQDTAKIMYSEHFRSHPNCSITTAYGWNIEKKPDVKYLTSSGVFMEPFYTRVGVFHEHDLGIAILARGIDTKWELGFDMFVDKIVDTVPCKDRKSPLDKIYVDNDLGMCVFALEIKSLPQFSEDFNYIAKYSGCYVMHEYEHTTWLKFKKEFLKKICVSVEDNHLYISTGNSDIEFIALEMPGRTLQNDPLFITGIKDGDYVIIADGFSDISFEFIEGQDEAAYMTLSSVPFERATPVNFYSLLLMLGFSFLICFSFSVLHLSFCIYTFKEHTAMQKKRKASILINRVASLQRPLAPHSTNNSQQSLQDADVIGIDEEGRKLFYSYEDDEEAMSTNSLTGTAQSTRIYRFIQVKTVIDGIAIFLMICTSLNNVIALIGIVMNYSLFNQTKLFSQNEYGIQFFLFECQLGVLFDAASILALIAMFVVQLIHPKGKSRRVWLWVVMYIISTFIHLIWLAFCLYFNWFGTEYATV